MSKASKDSQADAPAKRDARKGAFTVPKKLPLEAYMLFCRANYEQVQEKFPELKAIGILTKLDEWWKACDATSRADLVEKAKEFKAQNKEGAAAPSLCSSAPGTNGLQCTTWISVAGPSSMPHSQAKAVGLNSSNGAEQERSAAPDKQATIATMHSAAPQKKVKSPVDVFTEQLDSSSGSDGSDGGDDDGSDDGGSSNESWLDTPAGLRPASVAHVATKSSKALQRQGRTTAAAQGRVPFRVSTNEVKPVEVLGLKRQGIASKNSKPPANANNSGNVFGTQASSSHAPVAHAGQGTRQNKKHKRAGSQ